jgi:hypothetical protein
VTPVLPVLTGPKGLPQHSLVNSIWEWSDDYLLQPDGPDAGLPWRYTEEQLLFLTHWYAVDENGRFAYRTGVFRRMKGAGKNPFGAAICAVEMAGPCRFAGWDEHGQPIAEPHHASWVQTAAVSKDQTRITMALFPAMFSKRLLHEYGVEMGKEIIYAHGGRCRIEAVTSSPRALEGPRATFVLRDETHHWLSSNEGHAMASVIERNAAKSRGGTARVLSITNAHNPAEDSVAQRDYEAYVQITTGKSKAKGFLYDCREAPPGTKLEDYASLKAGLLAARGDSVWVDVDRLIDEVWDPRTEPSTSRRFYLNQIIAAEDAWVAPHQWDQCARPGLVLSPLEEVCLGFDGSKSDDHTAFVACRVSDGALFTLGIWDPADYDGEVPKAEVDAAVHQAVATYTVDGFFSDVEEWESYLDKWEAQWASGLYVHSSGRHSIAWDMGGRTREVTQAVEALHNAIVERAVEHEGNRRASQYVYNARRRPNQYGVTFGKEHRTSSRKVDWLAAAVLARYARQQYILLPENKRRRKRTGKAMFA